MAKKGNRRSKSGWAYTKKYPHENHPARFRKITSDDIDYLTFTHSDKIDLPDGRSVQTIPLHGNIKQSEQGKSKSYVYPKVFRGKRSALGAKTTEFNLSPTDKQTVDKLFDTLPSENVPITGGAGQYRKRGGKSIKKESATSKKPLSVGATRTKTKIVNTEPNTFFDKSISTQQPVCQSKQPKNKKPKKDKEKR